MKTSRQRRWQAARKALGLCWSCGKQPLQRQRPCPDCMEKRRVTSRNLYRKKRGIPLEAPLWWRKEKPGTGPSPCRAVHEHPTDEKRFTA